MSAQTDRLSGALADRYCIERELGQGGMATVYLAEDLKHRRKVALKVLKPELAAVIGATRFLAEISTTANLQHPHILPLHDSGEVDGTAWYVMPFVEGESLRDRLNRERQLAVHDAVRIAIEVAGALDYAHRKGIIHRDIKPENILLHDGRAVVADFGIALAASKSDGSSRLTETGISLGTPHYMSPEQAVGERALDGRTDIYALGCVLYEMLTGEPPFSGPTAQAIVAKVMSAEPVPIDELRKTVPPHVAAAAHVALQRIPADRFASAADLAAALQNPALSPAIPGARREAPRRSRALTLAGWGLAVIAIAALAIHLLRDAGEATRARPVRFSFPITAAVGIDDRPAISPDGRFFVYTVSEGGVTRFHRRFMDSAESTPVVGTEGAQFPTISPDGRWLVYVGSDANVYKRSFDGGPPVRILQASNGPNGIAWSRLHGLVLGMPMFTPNRGLSLIADTGSTPRYITAPAGDDMHHEPLVPDFGNLALFQDFMNKTLGVMQLPDGAFRTLDARVHHLVGYARGVLLYIDPALTLMAVGFDPRTGTLTSKPVPVPDAPQGIATAALSPDGVLVIQVQPAGYRLEVVDERGVGTPVLRDTLREVNARYSPDGTRLALAMSALGAEGVRVYDFRTGLLSSLTAFTRNITRVEWTPDGKRIVVSGFGSDRIDWLAADASDEPSVLYSLPDSVKAYWASFDPRGRDLLIGTHLGTGANNISVARLEGDSALHPVLATAANESAPRLSPDGHWLTYASNESGEYQVYVRPYPGPGSREQVSVDGGTQPVWSRDGRKLFYRIGNAMMSVDVRPSVASGSMEVMNRRKLFEGFFYGNEASRIVAFYDVAPDGRHFLMARALEGRSEIEVWLNWMDELVTQIRRQR